MTFVMCNCSASSPIAAEYSSMCPCIRFFRYNFDPVDVEAEMEVTARVRKAAAEALMEAQEKLRAAEKAQAAMQAQLVHAEELHKVRVSAGCMSCCTAHIWMGPQGQLLDTLNGRCVNITFDFYRRLSA